jgi:outer membrane biosynthesis protein TonB
MPASLLLLIGLQVVAPELAHRGSFMTDDDYPANALRNKETASVRLALTIDAAGKLVACKVTSIEGARSLEAPTCALQTRRARFVPAHDSSGNAVAGITTTTFNWMLPGVASPQLRYDTALGVNRLPAQMTAASATADFLLAADGSVEGCTISRSSGSAKLDGIVCGTTIAQHLSPPQIDGVPTRGVVRHTVLFYVEQPSQQVTAPSPPVR